MMKQRDASKELDWYEDIDQILTMIPNDEKTGITESNLGKKLATGVVAASVALNGSSTNGELLHDSGNRSQMETVIAQKQKMVGQPEQLDKKPQLAVPEYPAGDSITIAFSELGNPSSKYSTNESIKTYRQLDSIADVDGCNKSVLEKIQIVITIIDPNDSVQMKNITDNNFTTAYTGGLRRINGQFIIPITSIPIPNTISLSNLLSHEIKHPFPYILVNILSSVPGYEEKNKDVPEEAYQSYSRKLDNTEHINKTGTEWTIEGGPFDAYFHAVQSNCVVLPAKLKSHK